MAGFWAMIKQCQSQGANACLAAICRAFSRSGNIRVAAALHKSANCRFCELIAKSTHSTLSLYDAGFAKPRGDAMPNVQTKLIEATPSIVPSDIPAMSDDECLVRLARAVEAHDSEHLDEVARLIGRLAVTIE